jgi:hypothetical protein
MSAGMGPGQTTIVGARIVVESERAARPPRRGVIEGTVASRRRAYRVLWDNGHTSIVRPASGCAWIDAVDLGADTRVVVRAINDRIRELGGSAIDMYSFVCECEDPGCTQPMNLSAAEYDALRASGGRLATLPGHEGDQRDHVVGRNERFVIVEPLHP